MDLVLDVGVNVMSRSLQIISSSTPCGDFFFRCCRTPELQPVEQAASRAASSSRGGDSRGSDITSIAKKCNEFDLNVIVIWKVCRPLVQIQISPVFLLYVASCRMRFYVVFMED